MRALSSSQGCRESGICDVNVENEDNTFLRNVGTHSRTRNPNVKVKVKVKITLE
jgi:hypothetical protein